MTEAHWYSLFCPHFSVFDLEKFFQIYSRNQSVTEDALNFAGFLRAGAWLNKNQERWITFRVAREPAIEQSYQKRFEIFCWGDEGYPENLKHLYFPPPVLFVSGLSACLREPLLSVVGARHPTQLGRLWVRHVVPRVAAHGVCIVSGGARGIDTEAHQAALDGQGLTLAFLPGEVGCPYPKSNHYLFDKIRSAGALVSEFPPNTAVRAENFHRRNRLIAGISAQVLVVEAAVASGTLMTANRAVAENREVLVVPGPPFVASYSGSLALLADGAIMVRDEIDVVAQLRRKNVLK